MADVDWSLKGHWNKDQIAFVIISAVYFFVIWLLWRTPVLLPFKLIVVFLHELSHATACKLTGGEVHGIEVKLDEGGVTRTSGGLSCCILPAGYLGSSFWGMALIIMSTNYWSRRVAAVALGLALLYVLFKEARNWLLRGLCIGFLAFLIIVWVVEELTFLDGLEYVILFMGVMNGMYSVYDIYDDTVARRVNSSDAEKFAKDCPCPCDGRMWGLIWVLISSVFFILAIYLSLVILQ